jgi:CspA family cold shock protein
LEDGRNEGDGVKGIVKFYNEAKGFGFIGVEGGEDVFVHYNAIQVNGYRSLPEGASVEFETVRGKKGLQAENVRLLDVNGEVVDGFGDEDEDEEDEEGEAT